MSGMSVLTLLIAGAALAQVPPLESAVKATYVYKFAAFVEWPEASFTSDDSPLTICVAGDDGPGRLIGQAAKGQAVGRHPIVVRRLTQAVPPLACHVLYVAGLRADAIGAYLDAAAGAGVLTVTDSADERPSQGVINFLVRDNRVRFEIDLEKAARQRLAISSKLVNLALRVQSRDNRMP
jgi:hypothetical protein